MRRSAFLKLRPGNPGCRLTECRKRELQKSIQEETKHKQAPFLDDFSESEKTAFGELCVSKDKD